MRIKINSTTQLGAIAKVVRKNQDLSQELFAATAGFGERFIREVEKGKSTAEIGRVFRQLSELGINVWLDIPDSVSRQDILNMLEKQNAGSVVIVKDDGHD